MSQGDVGQESFVASREEYEQWVEGVWTSEEFAVIVEAAKTDRQAIEVAAKTFRTIESPLTLSGILESIDGQHIQVTAEFEDATAEYFSITLEREGADGVKVVHEKDDIPFIMANDTAIVFRAGRSIGAAYHDSPLEQDPDLRTQAEALIAEVASLLRDPSEATKPTSLQEGLLRALIELEQQELPFTRENLLPIVRILLGDETGPSLDMVEHQLRQLVDRGYIVWTGNGEPFVLTETAHQVLEGNNYFVERFGPLPHSHTVLTE